MGCRGLWRWWGALPALCRMQVHLHPPSWHCLQCWHLWHRLICSPSRCQILGWSAWPGDGQWHHMISNSENLSSLPTMNTTGNFVYDMHAMMTRLINAKITSLKLKSSMSQALATLEKLTWGSFLWWLQGVLVYVPTEIQIGPVLSCCGAQRSIPHRKIESHLLQYSATCLQCTLQTCPFDLCPSPTPACKRLKSVADYWVSARLGEQCASIGK